MSEVVRLIAGEDGRLTTPVGETLPVRVFERDRDVLMLVLLLDADGGIEPEPVEPMLLEYTSVHGLVRLRGEATLTQRDLLQFQAVDPPEVLQRREFVRVDSSQRVVVSTGEDGSAIETHAIDVSGGGMLLRAGAKLEPGSEIRFRLELGPDEGAVEGRARVVRAGEDGKLGVVFEEISSGERQRLIRFIFDRQRAALAKTRRRADKRKR